MKRLVFTNKDVSGSDPHSGGGCNLPETMKWPLDSDGKPLLHILTVPATWSEARSNLWISIFIPFDTPDSLLHWDLLTASDKNTSTIIIHSNKGTEVNKFFDMESKSKLVQVGEAGENEENFVSKISKNVDWLQGAEGFPDQSCRFMLNGDDFDFAFGADAGIFSGGFLYILLPHHEKCETEKVSGGKVLFQFS